MSTQVDLKEGMIVNLVKVNEKDAKTSADSTDILPLSDANGNISKITVNNLLSPVAGGIGNAITTTMPVDGINTYNVQGGAGTYTNFLASLGTPIVFDNVTDAMTTKNWQMRRVGVYWQKYEIKGNFSAYTPNGGSTKTLQDIDNDGHSPGKHHEIVPLIKKSGAGIASDGSFVYSGVTNGEAKIYLCNAGDIFNIRGTTDITGRAIYAFFSGATETPVYVSGSLGPVNSNPFYNIDTTVTAPSGATCLITTSSVNYGIYVYKDDVFLDNKTNNIIAGIGNGFDTINLSMIGYWAAGKVFNPLAGYYASKRPIPVLPGSDYTYSGVLNSAMRNLVLDSDFNVLQTLSTSDPFTTHASAAYILLCSFGVQNVVLKSVKDLKTRVTNTEIAQKVSDKYHEIVPVLKSVGAGISNTGAFVYPNGVPGGEAKFYVCTAGDVFSIRGMTDITNRAVWAFFSGPTGAPVFTSGSLGTVPTNAITPIDTIVTAPSGASLLIITSSVNYGIYCHKSDVYLDNKTNAIIAAIGSGSITLTGIGYWTAGKAYAQLAGYYCSKQPIPVLPNTAYTYSGTLEFGLRNLVLDGDFNVLQTFASTDSYQSFTTHVNAAYILLSNKSTATVTLKASSQVLERITALELGGVGNVLYGKTALFGGDSICEDYDIGTNTYIGYAKRIGIKNSMTWVNAGLGGTAIAKRTGRTDSILERIIANSGDYDYIILQGGINDAFTSVPLGTISSGYAATLDEFTFCGALESLFKQMATKWQGKKTGFIITYNAPSASPGFESYMTQAKLICQKWSIPYIDLFTQSDLCFYLTTIKNNFMKSADGTHVNDAGYDVISPKIEAWMRTL